MRFLSNGPDIPDDLLQRRDEGSVVFLCGAGISKNAKVPLFDGLAKRVAESLGVLSKSELAKTLRDYKKKDPLVQVSLDQIFMRLQQDYDTTQVNECITDIISSSQAHRYDSGQSKEHQLIVRLSANQIREPQIVTTNFDWLLECGACAEKRAVGPPSVAPWLPNIDAGTPITGITYLHGRLQTDSSKSRFYITSSAEFGLAYLAEGWATAFVRSLLSRYTVVLVGYQAQDPPVRYLLEGLNRQQVSDRDRLYVFDRGPAEVVRDKWSSRGVTPIPYSTHAALWKSFEKWAQRADDPIAWRDSVMKVARRRPGKCKRIQRGQVAHVARSVAGARAFADCDINSPHPEWLCVFDVSCRTAKPHEPIEEDQKSVDPAELYGLDSDLPRSVSSSNDDSDPASNLLAWLSSDSNPSDSHQIGNQQVTGQEATPSRLEHLMEWLTKHLDAPVVAWWALQQHGLHPKLVKKIHLRLRSQRETQVSPKVRRLWEVILELQTDSRRTSWRVQALTEIEQRVKREGWTPRNLRDFQAASAPRFAEDTSQRREDPWSFPEQWGDHPISEMLALTVEFPRELTREYHIPEHHDVCRVLPIIEAHLQRAAGMMQDINKTYVSTPHCYWDWSRVSDWDLPFSSDRTFALFLGLFTRMIECDSAQARAHAVTWCGEDPFFFRKLKLFALNQESLFGDNEAAEALSCLSSAAFWDRNVQEELLTLMKKRWCNLRPSAQHCLAKRLLEGPKQQADETAEDWARVRDYLMEEYGRWLLDEQYPLADEQRQELVSLMERVSDRKEAEFPEMDTATAPCQRTKTVEEQVDELLTLLASEVEERILGEGKLSMDDRMSKIVFAHLVQKQPDKALLALTHCLHMRRREFLAMRIARIKGLLWTWLHNWHDGCGSITCVRLFLDAISTLSPELSYHLSEPLGEWFRRYFADALAVDSKLAWRGLDSAIEGLRFNGERTTTSESALGESDSRYKGTHADALIYPAGRITQAVLNTLLSVSNDRQTGIPKEIGTRLKHLTATPGAGSDHAAAVLGNTFTELYSIDSKWVKGAICQWLRVDHALAKPAWSGFRFHKKPIPAEVSRLVRKRLFELFPKVYSLGWEEETLEWLAREIVSSTICELGVGRKERIDERVRECLQNLNDDGRVSAIYELRSWSLRREYSWRQVFVPFMNRFWPKERKYRSATTTFAFVDTLSSSGDEFLQCFEEVKRFLIPVSYDRSLLASYGNRSHRRDSLVMRFPAKVLEMLDLIVGDESESVPFDLEQIVWRIGEVDPSTKHDLRWLRLVRLVEYQ